MAKDQYFENIWLDMIGRKVNVLDDFHSLWHSV